MRKALVVGINYYEKDHIPNLRGCVPDAFSVNSVLERNSDGTKNFDVKLETASDHSTGITKNELKNYVKELFDDDCEIALFYFSGHGYIENTGGFIITSDCENGDDGLSLTELLKIVNASKAKNRIVILDSCYSGEMGNFDSNTDTAFINEGVTILTASRKTQYSMDERDGGTFTKLFVDALNGTAANLLGEITPGSVYAHIDQSLGAWGQRPLFKTNIKSFVCLRRTVPPISLEELKKLTIIFENDFEYKLDPSYEPESDCPQKENTEIFATLQKYNRVNLVVPVNAQHMYFAAINSKSCKLTTLGEFYWKLVKNGNI